MKILVLAPIIVPHHTGTPIRIFEVSERLGKKHEVFVLSLGPKKGIIKKDTFKIKIIPYGRFAHLKFLFDIIRYAKNYDIIYSHTYLPNLLGILCKFLHRRKIVCDVHGFVFSQIKFKNFIKRYMIKSLEKISLKKSDHIIAVSNTMKNEIMKFGVSDKQIDVVETGCPEIRKISSSDIIKKLELKKNRTIGYIGNFNVYQGVIYLLDAFMEIIKKYKGSKLILVGGTESDIMNLRKKYDSLDIIFKKRSPRDIAFKFINACDILVIPRPKILATDVGFPTKLSEYSILGKAIIATDVGDHARIIKNGHNGIIINSEDIENELIQKVGYLFENPKKIGELGKNAKKYASKNLTWNVLVKKIESILLHCLSN